MCKRFLLLIAALALLSASTHSFSMEIVWAIGAGNIGRVRELVEVEQVDVNNITDDGGRTLLYWACRAGNLDIVLLLLPRCIDATVNKAAIDGFTPLYWACYNGDLAIVQLLLPRCTNATVNKVAGDGLTPLYWACYNGNLAMVQLLLEYGANVDLEPLAEVVGNYNRPGGTEIFRHLNLAQDLDDSESMFKFIDNQTNADQEFLRERLWKKHGIKVERKERTRVKRLLLEEDERVPMDSVCCVNGTTRIFNCIA